MESFAENRLRLIRAQLAAVVLVVEDGECELPPGAVAELRRIESYLDRISARVDPARIPVPCTSSGDLA